VFCPGTIRKSGCREKQSNFSERIKAFKKKGAVQKVGSPFRVKRNYDSIGG
jgi:hypothetical protein